MTELREKIARIVDPHAFDNIPAPLTRFRGMSYHEPENGHHVWDTRTSGICNSNGPDSRMPWPKLATREDADAAAERLNNEGRLPFLAAQERALAKADAILALIAPSEEA